MPQLIPFIPLLAAGATAGTSLGLTLSGAGQPSQGAELAAQQQQLQQSQQQQAQAAAQQQQKAISANIANSQEQTGGNVTDTGLVSLASIIAGLPGSGTTAPGSPGSKSLADYLGTGSQPTQTNNVVSATYGSLNGGQG